MLNKVFEEVFPSIEEKCPDKRKVNNLRMKYMGYLTRTYVQKIPRVLENDWLSEDDLLKNIIDGEKLGIKDLDYRALDEKFTSVEASVEFFGITDNIHNIAMKAYEDDERFDDCEEYNRLRRGLVSAYNGLSEIDKTAHGIMLDEALVELEYAFGNSNRISARMKSHIAVDHPEDSMSTIEIPWTMTEIVEKIWGILSGERDESIREKYIEYLKIRYEVELRLEEDNDFIFNNIISPEINLLSGHTFSELAEMLEEPSVLAWKVTSDEFYNMALKLINSHKSGGAANGAMHTSYTNQARSVYLAMPEEFQKEYEKEMVMVLQEINFLCNFDAHISERMKTALKNGEVYV